MTELHRKELRRLIDRGTMEAQHYARVHGYQVEDVIPEVIAALLSLASYTAKHNAGLSPDDFILATNVAMNENWVTN